MFTKRFNTRSNRPKTAHLNNSNLFKGTNDSKAVLPSSNATRTSLGIRAHKKDPVSSKKPEYGDTIIDIKPTILIVS